MLNSNRTKILAFELANRSLIQVIVETGFLVLIALTAFLGNSCVLVVFYKTPSFRKVVNFYFITLAISDVLLAGFIMPFAIGVAASGRDVIGIRAGTASGFIGLSLVYGSLLTTTLIAINRFFCVARPNAYRKYFKPKPAKVMIVMIWVFSVSLNTVTYTSELLVFDFYPDRMLHFPAFSSKLKGRVLAAFLQFMFVIIPLTISVECYYIVYKVVQVHNRTVSSNLNNSPSNFSTLSIKDIHITKSVLAMVCGFILCWIPCSTIYHVNEYTNIPRVVGLLSTYTAYASSAINPIVFNMFNKPFRKKFVRIFCSSRKITAVAAANN